MTKLSSRLYISDQIDDAHEIITSIKTGSVCFDVCFICLGNREDILLEILTSREMLKPHYTGNNYQREIVGIAKDKDDAFLLIKTMLSDFVKQDGNIANIKKFFDW